MEPHELKDRALNAADAMLLAPAFAKVPEDWTQMLRPLLAWAWLNGRQDGGVEAQEVVRSYIEGLR